MIILSTILLSISLLGASLAENKCELAHKGGSTKFPEKFQFGVATAAYQIEGGWNAEGKAPSVWDTFTHTHPEKIDDRSNGDDAAESYYRFEQDLAALKQLKVNYYRFSISWSRVLPRVTAEYKNEKGIAYYNKVIDQLLANNITPMVTMFHYDMPEELNKYNGFLNSSIIDYFTTYADFLYETFGDRVKLWITHNEPYVFCGKGYAQAIYPPAVHNPGVGDYICMDNVLKSHALAYRNYKQKYFSRQQGKVGIAIDTSFYYKESNKIPDEAVERGIQYNLGFLAEPIFGKTGNYPSIMISDIARNSLKEGLSASRLTVLSEAWSKLIKGSADFLGINYYGAQYVDIPESPLGEVPSFEHDSNYTHYFDANWKSPISDWYRCVPEGLEDLLKWIRDNYDNVEVVITENGWADKGRLDDSERVDYVKAHLQGVLNAINDGCHVTHYTYWSLIDNFEWLRGYTENFGLYYVNMSRADKQRVIKDSAKYYTTVIENRELSPSSGSAGGRQFKGSYFILALMSICVLANLCR